MTPATLHDKFPNSINIIDKAASHSEEGLCHPLTIAKPHTISRPHLSLPTAA